MVHSRDNIGVGVAQKIISNPKQPSCKKSVWPLRMPLWKRCEIQSGNQKMAVMVDQWQINYFNKENSDKFGAVADFFCVIYCIIHISDRDTD